MKNYQTMGGVQRRSVLKCLGTTIILGTGVSLIFNDASCWNQYQRNSWWRGKPFRKSKVLRSSKLYDFGSCHCMLNDFHTAGKCRSGTRPPKEMRIECERVYLSLKRHTKRVPCHSMIWEELDTHQQQTLSFLILDLIRYLTTNNATKEIFTAHDESITLSPAQNK